MSGNKEELLGEHNEYGVQYFTNIPDRVLYDKDLNLSDIRVYAIIKSYIDSGHKVYTSNGYLAKKLGCSIRTVISCLNSLTKKKYIRKISRSGQRYLKIGHDICFKKDKMEQKKPSSIGVIQTALGGVIQTALASDLDCTQLPSIQSPLKTNKNTTTDLKPNTDGYLFIQNPKEQFKEAREMLDSNYENIFRSSSFNFFEEYKLITRGNLIGFQSNKIDPIVIQTNLDRGMEQMKDEGTIPIKPFFNCFKNGTYWNYEKKKTETKTNNVARTDETMKALVGAMDEEIIKSASYFLNKKSYRVVDESCGIADKQFQIYNALVEEIITINDIESLT